MSAIVDSLLSLTVSSWSSSVTRELDVVPKFTTVALVCCIRPGNYVRPGCMRRWHENAGDDQ